MCVYKYLHMYIYIYIYMYLSLSLYIYVCMYVYIYIYTSTVVQREIGKGGIRNRKPCLYIRYDPNWGPKGSGERGSEPDMMLRILCRTGIIEKSFVSGILKRIPCRTGMIKKSFERGTFYPAVCGLVERRCREEIRPSEERARCEGHATLRC